MGRAVHVLQMRNPYNILIRKSVEKRPISRSGLWWEDAWKMDLKSTGPEDVDLMEVAQVEVQ